MLALKIIGSILAVTVVFIFWIFTRRIKLDIGFDTENGFECVVRFLFFKFDLTKPKAKKENKKPNKLVLKLKKALGLDFLEKSEELKQDGETKTVSDTVNKVVTAISLFAGQVAWLFKRFKLRKLKVTAVCAGDDAADAAIEYGLVCAAIYPMSAYLDTNIKTKKNVQEINIGCDFNGNAYFELGLKLSVRIIHVLRAVYRNAMESAERATYEEAKQ